MKLSTTSNQLAVADYFTMFNTVSESAADTDLGSGGALVLPDMVDGQGHTRQLAVGAGKDSNLYLVDRSNMGKFNPANDNAIYQELDGVLPGGVWAMPAYFNGTLYYGSVGNNLQAFPFQNARLTNSSSQTAVAFAYPGTTPSISANGSSNGIVWATENTSPAVLHAYAATNLAHEYYNSTQVAGGRDSFGNGNKFITPMIASARVYVGTTTGVGVLGLLDQSTLTPLQIWRNSYFGNPSNVGAGANGASPAGDGVPNLIKYALGLNPTNPATAAQLPSGGIQPDRRNELPDPDRQPRRRTFRHHLHCRSLQQSDERMGFRPAEHRHADEHGHAIGRARQHARTGGNRPVHSFAGHESLTERSMKFSACLLRAS